MPGKQRKEEEWRFAIVLTIEGVADYQPQRPFLKFERKSFNGLEESPQFCCFSLQLSAEGRCSGCSAAMTSPTEVVLQGT